MMNGQKNIKFRCLSFVDTGIGNV